MRCEECLPLLDEYAYGEIKAPLSETVAAHLGACTVCTKEWAALRQERDFFVQGTVKASPALLNAVRMRIAEESATRASGHLGKLRGLLAGAFMSSATRPAFGVVAMLMILALALVLFRYAQSGRDEFQGESISQNNPRDNISLMIPADPPNEVPAGEMYVRPPDIKSDKEIASQLISGGASKDRRAVVPQTVKTRAVRVKQNVSNTHPKVVPPQTGRGLSINTTSAIAGAVRIQNTNTPEFDVEIARHIEKSQMLLRSFKNGGLSEGDITFDLVYEKQMSKSLLNKNILLRHDAEDEGDEAAQTLLNRLEPILRDIANLKGNSYLEDARLIKERMRREEIIPALRLF
jgi:hypothetical protein